MCHMLIYILRKDYFPMTTNYDTTAGQPLFVCLYTLNVKTAEQFRNLYINLACLSVWVSVCLYPINVKTAEPIGPKFFVGPHVKNKNDKK